MRLKQQLNLSFFLLLFVILSLTAILFYMMSFQLLIKEQRTELQARGKAWIKTAVREDQAFYRRDLLRLERIPLRTGKADVVLYDSGQKSLVFSSLNQDQTNQVVHQLRQSKKQGPKNFWLINGNKYIVAKFSLKTPKNHHMAFILASPLEGVRTFHTKFSLILLSLLLIGGLLALIMSHFITRRLLNPLSKVNNQLKKVERRQFSQIEEIRANGEIGEVAHNTYQMAMELHHYIESQKNFFQNASHDLKTPLMSIQGFAEGIIDGVFAEEQVNQSLKMIVTESERLKHLVDDMIILAKLESYEESYDTEIFPLGEVLNDAMNRVLALAEQRHIEMKALSEEGKWSIRANRERVLQAFINLLENAIRYANTTVFTRIHSNGAIIELVIEDDGPGIPEGLLPKVFHRFIKGEKGNNGLGLAITRAIIEKSQGEIRVENRLEGGARFTIRLPLVTE